MMGKLLFPALSTAGDENKLVCGPFDLIYQLNIIGGRKHSNLTGITLCVT